MKPVVDVSGVDEDDVDLDDPEAAVLELATRKAATVARRHNRALVIGCDSMLVFAGKVWGKPADSEDAAQRWRAMRGGSGRLITGHCVVDAASGNRASGVASTVVRFGSPSNEEIDAYVSSGEPLGVAGAFTLDGLSAPFIDGLDGDPSNVIGLSLPLLRMLLAELGVGVTELWAR